MIGIRKFKFKKEEFPKLKDYNFGSNWPVVYLIKNDKEVYVGETTSLYNRSHQHYENPERKRLREMYVITDEEYNKSAALDIESSLIQYMAADGKFLLQNSNQGIQNHNYFDKPKYQDKFKNIWKELQQISLVKHELVQIENSDLFKYSPYKALTDEQLMIANQILYDIKTKSCNTFIIHGGPGTGKTILATFLVKSLKELEETRGLKVGLVLPMVPIRQTLKKVFKGIKNLRASMVIGPSQVTKKYDVLVVDEAHRLSQGKNIMYSKSFDSTNKLLGLNKNATQLDWVMKCAEVQIFFYDEGQSVRPSDVSPKAFTDIPFKEFKLRSQIRIGTGDDGEKYIQFIQDLFDLAKVNQDQFTNYDFRIYDDIHQMVLDIKEKNTDIGICRIVSGYAWPWVSKKDPNKHDIEIDGLRLKWNSVRSNWVYSKNAINEVGCIHTVQGYDLNYAGVIIGPEISYNPSTKEFIIYPEKYRDINGKRGVESIDQLKLYIINIYKTLLTRGIMGTYVYIVDDNLREYFKKAFY